MLESVCELLALDRLQILFVENDLNTRERMQRALGEGFTLECVASITEAKSYLDTSVPDILISEVVVGPENGLDLCRYVRSVPVLHSLPIVLLTSLATLQDKVAGFCAGTDDYAGGDAQILSQRCLHLCLHE